MPQSFKAVPIGDIAPAELRDLLVLQGAEWEATLRWDFRGSAQRVHFLAELGALDGFALIHPDGRSAGYACPSGTGTEFLRTVGDVLIAHLHRGHSPDRSGRRVTCRH